MKLKQIDFDHKLIGTEGIVVKDVEGWEGLYTVSSLGDVISIGRTINRKKGALKPVKLAVTGYMAVGLSRNGKTKKMLVHRIVATAFLGKSNKQIDHIDGNKENNALSNLRYCSARENATYPNRSNFLKFTSKYPGVHFKKESGKWVSRIRVNGKQKHLGSFLSEVDASNAYQNELAKQQF